MIYQMYSICDDLQKEISTPVFFRSDSELLRNLKTLFLDSDVKHPYVMFSSDFSLYTLGSFDTRNASFSLFSEPVKLLDMVDFKDCSLDDLLKMVQAVRLVFDDYDNVDKE